METDRRGRGPSGSIRGERERLTSASYRVPEVGTFAQHLLRAGCRGSARGEGQPGKQWDGDRLHVASGERTIKERALRRLGDVVQTRESYPFPAAAAGNKGIILPEIYSGGWQSRIQVSGGSCSP